MKKLTFTTLIAAGIAMSGGALAQVYEGLTMTTLQAVFQSNGLSVSTTNDTDVIVVNKNVVWLTECNIDGRCNELAFFNNFSDVRPTLEAVNKWNNERKIPEASVNPDGSLHMEMWMSTIGATNESILDTYKWYDAFVADIEYWAPYFVDAGA